MITWCVECGERECRCVVSPVVQFAQERTRRLHNEQVQREEREAAQPVKVGDFFVCSWGYDQTNTDFYEVLSLSASGKTAKVRKVATATISESQGSAKVAPIPGSVHPWDGEVQTKRLRDPEQSGCREWSFFVASYADAYLWDCKPAYETAQGWGH